jgi:glycosyltransferase involved in cell wall biosynthesis
LITDRKTTQKITLIGPVFPYRGGIAHFTTLLAKQLMDAGHEVQVISFKKQYPAWLYPGESDKDHSPSRLKVPAEYLLSPLNPLSWRKTLRAIRDFQPDQVILPWWVTFWGPAFRHIIAGLKRCKIPVTMLIHNTMPHEARFFDRFLARRTLKGADRFIVMTEKEKHRLKDLLPAADNVRVAPLPIYRDFKEKDQTRTEIRQSLGLPESQPVILFFGFVRPYKGLNILIEALSRLVENGVQAHLLTVGEFWEDKAKYLSQITSLGLEEFVHINDNYIPDDDLAPFFKAADLFAAPYVGGTQSAALKTALGFGLPVVATQIIEDDFLKKIPDRCQIVPTGDSHALAEALKSQIKEPVQSEIEIEKLVAQSWSGMVATVTDRPLQTTPHEEQSA